MDDLLSDDLIGAIQQILILGKGDQGRLEYLLDLLQKGKRLPDSDKKYLQMIIPLYLGSKDPESYQKNTESTIEQLHDEMMKLNEKIERLQGNKFEKYIGRKSVLFLITVFVGWNVFQVYTQSILSDFISNNSIQLLFPLNLVASYFNYSNIVWVIFLILVISWPFIGSIHLAKFIQSRKTLNKH